MGNKVFCCKKLLTTSFCPDCGKPFSEASKKQESPYPVKFKTYLHGSGSEDEDRQEFISSLGLARGSIAAENIIGCDYEMGILWLKECEESNPEPIALLIGHKTYTLDPLKPGGEPERQLLKDTY